MDEKKLNQAFSSLMQGDINRFRTEIRDALNQQAVTGIENKRRNIFKEMSPDVLKTNHEHGFDPLRKDGPTRYVPTPPKSETTLANKDTNAEEELNDPEAGGNEKLKSKLRQVYTR